MADDEAAPPLVGPGRRSASGRAASRRSGARNGIRRQHRARNGIAGSTGLGAESAGSAGLGAKAKARDNAKRVLAPGTRGRGAALAGLHVYRETRRVSRDVRRLLTEAGVVEPKEPGYRQYCKEHDATEAQLRRRREASTAAVAPARFVVCVLAGTGEHADAALDATIANVRKQSWQHWKLVVCAGSGHVPRVRGDDVDGGSPTSR